MGAGGLPACTLDPCLVWLVVWWSPYGLCLLSLLGPRCTATTLAQDPLHQHCWIEWRPRGVYVPFIAKQPPEDALHATNLCPDNNWACGPPFVWLPPLLLWPLAAGKGYVYCSTHTGGEPAHACVSGPQVLSNQ